MTIESRARGALYGLAIGDALGMPTQSLPRSVIVRRYGELVDDFEPGPDDQPLAAGMPAATVTDDTEQALLLARLLVETDGRVPPHEWAQRLLAWEDTMRAKGSLDLLGPSTRRALTELMAGTDPSQTGRFGDTNGAAMRIAPVGIMTPADDLDVLVEQVTQASAVTHNTGIALSGAAAVAAAVSSALDGADLATATGTAVRAARLAAGRGHWIAGAAVADRIEWTVGLVAGRSQGQVIGIVGDLVGTSLHCQESVPAAFAVLHAAVADPWLTCRLGASVGGDCDTIAAMAGAMAGALSGIDALPSDVIERIDAANDLDVDTLTAGLLELRRPG